MKKSRQTKRALLTSVLAMLVCLSMLVGSTFAWFTDQASTGTNRIVSGRLDVELVYENGDPVGDTLDFVKAAGAEGEDILWEPGCTYNLPAICVKNNGNLALKYTITVNGLEGTTTARDGYNLMDVIDWTITKDGNTVDLATFEGHLLPGDMETTGLVISGHMQETADYHYMDLEASGITITVEATQDTVEHDSFTDQYDKVTYANDVDELNEALKAGGNITLKQDMDVTITNDEDPLLDGINNTNDTMLDLNGKNIDFQDNSGVYASPIMQYSSDLVIDGDGTITSSGIVVQAFYGSNITINSGTFIPTEAACVMVSGDASDPATVTINGGTFHQGGTYWTLQTYIAIPHDGPTGTVFEDSWMEANQPGCTIIVNGGTFEGRSPINFINPETHHIVEEERDGSIWYTVEPNT